MRHGQEFGTGLGVVGGEIVIHIRAVLSQDRGAIAAVVGGAFTLRGRSRALRLLR